MLKSKEFKIDLIVWKSEITLADYEVKAKFKIDLIVWKSLYY